MCKQKKDQQIISFCFTKYSKENHLDSLNETLGITEIALKSLGASYFIMGRELCPSTHHLHLQGYCQLTKKKRFSTIGKTLGCRIDICKGTAQDNYIYCSKNENGLGFVEYGTIKLSPIPTAVPPGSTAEVRSQNWTRLIELAKKGQLDQCLETFPAQALIHWNKLKQIESQYRSPSTTLNRKCLWIWGEPGTGKSRFVNEYFPNAYWGIGSLRWAQGYRPDEHNYFVYDDIDLNNKQELRQLKRMTDVYPLLLDVKHSDVQGKYERFIVTSNYHPSQIWTDIKEYKPLLRRFITVKAIKWDDSANDLIVKLEEIEITLGGHLIEINFF